MKSLGRICLAIVILLSGCVRMQPPQGDERLGRYRFNYAIDADPSCGLIQAFDDGSQTLAQLAEDSPLMTRQISAKRGGSNQQLQVVRLGQFLMVKALGDSVDFKFNSKGKADKCKNASIFLIHSMR